jgi:hypothetical protein
MLTLGATQPNPPPLSDPDPCRRQLVAAFTRRGRRRSLVSCGRGYATMICLINRAPIILALLGYYSVDR